jgi:hypothetical protein
VQSKLNKKIPSVIFILIFLSIELSGCMSFSSYSEDTNTKYIIGTWTGNVFPPNDKNGNTILMNPLPISITFFLNGTYWTAKRVLHKWQIQEEHRTLAPNRNIITLTANNVSVLFLYKLSDNNTKLYLYGPSGIMWLTKQKG